MPNPTKEFYAVEDYLPDQGPFPELGEPGADPRETWRRLVIDGLATEYEISDYGRCVNFKGRPIRVGPMGGESGTHWVGLQVDGKRQTVRMDKVVLETFSGAAPGEDMEPLHLNGDLTDCRITNLKWAPKETVRAHKRKSKPTLNTAWPNTPVGELPAAEAKPEPKKRRGRKAPAARKKSPAALTVSRVYQRGGMQAVVDEQGRTTLNKKSNLSTEDMAALAEIAAAVVELNTVMKL